MQLFAFIMALIVITGMGWWPIVGLIALILIILYFLLLGIIHLSLPEDNK
jgi:archaellum biogenesis protein FlaJ (TadC family)